VRLLPIVLFQPSLHFGDLFLLILDDVLGQLAHFGFLALRELDLRHVYRALMVGIMPRTKSTSGLPDGWICMSRIIFMFASLNSFANVVSGAAGARLYRQ
jgi:hypothetical protein